MNLSENGSEWKKSAYIVAMPWLLTLSLIAMISNTFVIFRLTTLQRHFSINMRLTFSLAVADLWVSFLMLIGLVGNSLLPNILHLHYEDMACFILTLEAFKFGAILTSILHLLILSANQCFSIVSPLKHKVVVSSRVCKLTLILLWTLPPACFFIYFYVVPQQGYQSYKCTNLEPYQMRTFRTTVFCLVVVPMVLMMTSYLLIWIYLNRSVFPRCDDKDCPAAINRTSYYRRRIQTLVTTFLILGSFVFGWFPSILFYVIVCENCVVSRNRIDPHILFALGFVQQALVLAKLSLNPFIYAPGIKIVKKLQHNRVGTNRADRSECISRYETVHLFNFSHRRFSETSAAALGKLVLFRETVSPYLVPVYFDNV